MFMQIKSFESMSLAIWFSTFFSPLSQVEALEIWDISGNERHRYHRKGTDRDVVRGDDTNLYT